VESIGAFDRHVHSMSGHMTNNHPDLVLVKVAGLGDTRSFAYNEGQGTKERGGETLPVVRLGGVKVTDEGGPITRGTLLCTSSTPGHLMAQGDPRVRACTVAKALQPVAFNAKGRAEHVYAVLMCG